MKSMTGYGRGTAGRPDGTQAIVEISAVNSKKQLEMRISAPKELGLVEPEMRSMIQAHLVRGTLTVSVAYQMGQESMNARMPVDAAFAEVVVRQLAGLAKANGLPAPTLAEVLVIPGVLRLADNIGETLKPLILTALKEALDSLEAMRLREGAALKADLTARGQAMSALVEKIGGREQEAIVLMKQRLQERIAALGVELPLDDERLAKELAFYVEKADITEEVVRLRSHLNQYAAMMESREEAGRNLDFLTQEMSREVNTLSAKTADMTISQDALQLKIELSKIREQIMNVE